MLKSSAPVLARVEARYVRPVEQSEASALSVRIQGEVGHSDTTAALEVVVKNASSEAIRRPVLEIVLPSAALLSAPALEAIANDSSVARVEKPDRAGVLRIHLASLGAKQKKHIPLPIVWVGEGKVKGLSVSVYDANTPWLISSTPGRTIHLKPAPVETWK